jgi:hypothetical protein
MKAFSPRPWMGRAAIAGAAMLVPSAAFAYGPGAKPSEAVINAAWAVFGQGNFLALILAGLWVGLVAAEARKDAATARNLGAIAAVGGVLGGWALGAPAFLSIVIAGAGLGVAILIALRIRLPGLAAALPPVAVAAPFGLGLGSTLRIGGAPLGYVAAYFVTFILSALAAAAVGRLLARPVIRGGERMVRGLGVWGAIISLPLIAMALIPQGPAFGGDTIDLRVRSPQLAEDEIQPLVKGLLEQVYLAFEKTDENEIYDSLAAVTEEEVLIDLYLQKRTQLVMEETGGARATLRSLDLVSASGEALPGNAGYSVHGVWDVKGTVGHWGHLHDRVNRYEADIAIAPVEGVWKIAGFDLRDVVRTNTASVAAQAP